MLRAYKFRLFPNTEQVLLMEKHFGCVRWIWNWALAKRIELWTKEKKAVSCMSLSVGIPALKKSKDTEWLSEVNAQSLQGSLRNLDAAYTRFFREKKGHPHFKAKRNKQSFQSPQGSSVDFANKTLTIRKIPDIRYRDSREFLGEIKTVTISRVPSGKYFASILVDDGAEAPKPKTKLKQADVVGVDLGLKDFCVLSTGEKVERPKWLTRSQRKLSRMQRALDRKEKESSNREKCRKRLAILHEKVANQRKDFQHKLSTRIIRENQAVALENLDVSELKQNSRLSAAVSDAAWAQFVTMLTYKAWWNGKTILKIGQFEPSSKLCSCGVINRNLTLKMRTWTCPACGATHDRDILAANNIKRMALNPQNFLAAGSREFKPVENHWGS